MSRFIITAVRASSAAGDELANRLPLAGASIDMRADQHGLGPWFYAVLEEVVPAFVDGVDEPLWLNDVVFRPYNEGEMPEFGMRAFPVELGYVLDPALREAPIVDLDQVQMVALVEIDDADNDVDADEVHERQTAVIAGPVDPSAAPPAPFPEDSGAAVPVFPLPPVADYAQFESMGVPDAPPVAAVGPPILWTEPVLDDPAGDEKVSPADPEPAPVPAFAPAVDYAEFEPMLEASPPEPLSAAKAWPEPVLDDPDVGDEAPAPPAPPAPPESRAPRPSPPSAAESLAPLDPARRAQLPPTSPGPEPRPARPASSAPAAGPDTRRPLVIAAVAASILVLGGAGVWALSPRSSQTDEVSAPASPSPTETTTSTTTPPPPPPSPESIAKIRPLLPAGYPPQACRPISAADPGGLVTMACGLNDDPGGPTSAEYTLFTNRTALIDSFNRTIETSSQLICPGNIQSPGPWRRNRTPEKTSGILFCGNRSEQPTVIWTDEERLLLNVVQTGDGGPNLDQLYGWWTQHS